MRISERTIVHILFMPHHRKELDLGHVLGRQFWKFVLQAESVQMKGVTPMTPCILEFKLVAPLAAGETPLKLSMVNH